MHIQLLPYQKNSAVYFEHFAHLPHAVFLDSSGCGQYDIITADPIILISDGTHQAIFEAVKEALSSFKKSIPASAPSHLPFTVGAIGYLSYDSGKHDEKIPSFAKKDIGIPEAVIGIYDWSIVSDHTAEKTYFISARDLIENQKILENALNTSIAKTETFKVLHAFESNMTKQSYKNNFDLIKRNIFDGNCYQVNLAQRFSSVFEGDPWNAYKVLRKKNPAPFSAFIRLKEGAILSMSPERFIKCDENQVETKPIKGTSKRFEDPRQDALSANALQNSLKDRAENVMIVDLLRNDLSKSCIAGSVKTPKICALESFKNVHHLVSTITGTLKKDKTAIDLLRSCFPGGSITGAPKIAAMTLIEKTEPHHRSLYCGSIFYVDIFDHMDSNIAIRTVICDQKNIHCYAGGGIVYDSLCEQEYEECLAKVGNILKFLSEL